MHFFPKNHSLGKSLLLPYTLVFLVLDFTQMVLAVQKHLEMAIIIILNNLAQPPLIQIFQKIPSLGKSLLLPYTLVSLGLDFTQMVLAVGKHLDMAIMIILNNIEQRILLQFFQKFSLCGRWLWLSRNNRFLTTL